MVTGWDWVLFVVTLLVVLLALSYLKRIHEQISIQTLVNDAVGKSAFRPTEFLIYDNSTEDSCDRLIVVEPFVWYLWACDDNLWILNPEGGVYCGANSCPAVRVTRTDFIETCLKLHVDSIVTAYKKKPLFRIPYDIDKNETRFTILSAINILVKDWLIFDSKDHGKKAIKLLEGRPLTKAQVVELTSSRTTRDLSTLKTALMKHGPSATRSSRQRNLSKDLFDYETRPKLLREPFQG